LKTIKKYLFFALLFLPASLWAMEIHVSISDQRLFVIENGDTLKNYPVSTSKYGIGNESGSYKTPIGHHVIAKKYGADAAIGAIFKARINTGRVAEIITEPRNDDNDYVTTRILWLRGTEPGVNRGEGIDSFHRYIYIHGTHEEGLIGQPASHGCIRMYNRDVIELYDLVEVGTPVIISE
jgi:lipoprotein-anchoring transpeptidase ErfK/SrfK